MCWKQFLFIVFICGSHALSRQQLRKTGNIMKKSCMGKIKDVTEEQVAAATIGQFIEDKNVMCYLACIYQLSGLVKNGKFSYDAAIKQVDIMYPPDMKEAFKQSVTNCKGIADKYKDLCEVAFYITRCIYEDNPSNFVV
uniref:Odorant-binding protein 13 n=1 Tax=Heortia vitessoides TaxID=1557813 RepID=A0A978W7A6_9NEOP|nr:odorant-binding protein 13 [Heortia vitessoides]